MLLDVHVVAVEMHDEVRHIDVVDELKRLLGRVDQQEEEGERARGDGAELERQLLDVGKQLLDHFMASARSDGVARVHLEVRDGNPAVEMYRRAGFEPAGRRQKYYRGDDGHQFDAITFACEL